MIHLAKDQIETLKSYIKLCWPMPWNAEKKVFIGVDWGYTLYPSKKHLANNPPRGSNNYRFHHGADWYGGQEAGADLVAMADGKCLFAGWLNRWYGNVVVLEHDFGLGEPYYTLYAHIDGKEGEEDGFVISVGDVVEQFELIAFCGTSGNSVANHLHGELRKGANKRAHCVDIIPFLTEEVDHAIFTSWEGELILRMEEDGGKPNWIVEA